MHCEEPATNPSFRGHHLVVDRIRRSLYYGKVKEENEVTDCPSLPLTEATVDMFERALKRQASKTSTGSVSRGLSVLDINYACTVSQKVGISPCSIILAIIYIERLRKKNPDYLKTSSPCDLFLISMLVASKYLYDDGEDEEVLNGEWAASGALELAKLNELELDFLVAIDWDLHVMPDHFYKKLSMIEHLVAWRQTQLRTQSGAGCTYAELLTLESSLQWTQVTDDLLKTFAFSLFAYGVVMVAVIAASVVACSVHTLLLTPNTSAGSQQVLAALPAVPAAQPALNQSRLCWSQYVLPIRSASINRSHEFCPLTLTVHLPSA